MKDPSLQVAQLVMVQEVVDLINSMEATILSKNQVNSLAVIQ